MSSACSWWVYLVRAANGALYCGMSNDPQRRFAQHCRGQGARFFHASPAQALVYVEACADKSAALRRERAIKALSKAAKERLVRDFTARPAQDYSESLPPPAEHTMHELILHHYDASPFAEKTRLLLGYKQLSWRSVEIPRIMPKPDLLALTGGYRKTPVLQVGADIYCDSALIARRLEAEKATPALFPEGQEFVVASLAQWADSTLFLLAVSLAFQPEVLASRLQGLPAAAAQAFIDDRRALFAGGAARLPAAEHSLQHWPTLMQRLELQLQREDGEFLCGRPSLADFAVAHPLWFLAGAPQTAPLLAAYPAVNAWLARVLAFGHGSPRAMSSADALAVAREATPAPLPERAGQWPAGFQAGQVVHVAACDYGVDPVQGELLHVDDECLILAREDDRAGRVHVHLPRLGFVLRAQ